MSWNANNGFDEWGGYMAAKITKLEEQFSSASDPFRKSNLFAGISIFVNGRTDPSADELKRIMMVHGGTFHHYERSHTTYIIASNLPDVKVRNMNTSKIISAKWVVDCLREGRIVDFTRYLLYSNKRPSQPSLSFGKQKKDEITLSPPSKAISAAVREEVTSEVSAILQDLHELNAKMRQNVPPQTDLPKKNDEIERKPIKDAINANNNGMARTAVDPKFLTEFYNNSRLHHIATLGAGFKQYVSELREKHANGNFPAREELRRKLKSNNEICDYAVSSISSCVMHIDMDCFFVSVGLRKYPHLRGQPVAVTHSKGGSAASNVPVHPKADRQLEMELFAERFEQHLHNNILSDKVRHGFDHKMSLSEIASCSYEARSKGLRNGMFVGQAIKLCPELKTMPYDFEGYREVSFALYDTIAQYTVNIEAVSCDEMFIDLTDLLENLKISPMTFVKYIREEVRQKTGCPCSAGVGANKLQARMATKHAKPDGQYHLETDNVVAYMADIPIRDLPGVGSSTTYTLKDENLITCGDLQKVSLAKLQMMVGKKFGETLHQFCRGIDNRPLTFGQIRKSVSAEVNYGIRFSEYADLETFLIQLSTEVHTRLNDIQRKTKSITLKLMVRAKDAPVETSKFMGHGVCDNVTKTVSLAEYTNDLVTIKRTVLTTMKALALPPNELRGIGIQLSKLDDPTEGKERKENVIKNLFNKVVEKQQQKAQTNEVPMPKLNDEEELKATTAIKSSPIKPTKRTRGRPAGLTNKKETSKRANSNVIDMLQNAAPKKISEAIPTTATSGIITNSQCPEDVDPTVFAELPHDIRAEILHERTMLQVVAPHADIKSSTAKPTSSSYELNESDFLPSTSKAAQEKREQKLQALKEPKIQVDDEFLQALPPDIRAEIVMQMQKQEEQANVVPSRASTPTKVTEAIEVETVEIAVDNIFAQTDCIDLLLGWVQSSIAPENYDVDLISEHAREFVRAKQINKLYDPLMYLCRVVNGQKTNENDCAWHMAYKLIIEAVQLEMTNVYNGRQLFLGIRLKCDKCSCLAS